MQHDIHYRDVVADVREFLQARVGQAEAAGVEEIWIDPGIGFGKTAEHNLALLHHLDALTSIGRPVVVGTSRKSFIGFLAPSADGTPAPVDDRLEGSLATAVWVMLRGAAMVRVHDVGPTRQAARLVDAARASAPLGAAR
jgi:dihydropteroate synthase